MSLNFVGVMNAVANISMKLGLFEKVAKHEPKNAPTSRLTTAIWVQDVGPADSGQASTSVKLVLTQRIYTSMISDPPDAIDPNVVNAVDKILTALTANFTLGGLVRCVDLLGLSGNGPPLSAQAGYLNQDGKVFRVMDITIPVILNDVWTQQA